MTEPRTDVMIVGAQKAATTTLFDMLVRSGRVVGARPKEPHFFSTAEDWRERLAEYHRIYRPRDGAIYCEASTSYTFFPHRRLEIWNDIRAYNPEMRIIYVVRKPTDRILSHFRHSGRRGFTRRGIRDFVLRYPLPLAICRYHTQISPFVEAFGRDRVLLLDYQDVVAMRRETLGELARFIGIDASAFEGMAPVHSNRSEDLRHHVLDPVLAAKRLPIPGLGGAIDRLARLATPQPPDVAELPPDLARTVVRLLELEISALERLMDRDLGAWRDV